MSEEVKGQEKDWRFLLADWPVETDHVWFIGVVSWSAGSVWSPLTMDTDFEAVMKRLREVRPVPDLAKVFRVMLPRTVTQ